MSARHITIKLLVQSTIASKKALVLLVVVSLRPVALSHEFVFALRLRLRHLLRSRETQIFWQTIRHVKTPERGNRTHQTDKTLEQIIPSRQTSQDLGKYMLDRIPSNLERNSFNVINGDFARNMRAASSTTKQNTESTAATHMKE